MHKFKRLVPQALVLLTIFAGFRPSPVHAADTPNFVWLISEDNSKHFLKLFDTNGAPTPNIEALAKDGIVYEHAFSNAPVCSVARSTLITGCYGPRIGTQYHRRSKMAPMPEGLKMFPAYLRDAGYFTTNKSKTDYNATPGKGVWDESSNKASWRKRKDGQPFFHKQSFGASHEGSLHFSKQVMETRKTTTDPSKVKLAPYHPDTPTFRYTYASYHDRIMEVDRQVGAVVDQLKQDGLLEDTFIFYFGDHGGVLPRGKGYAYESGLHVPLVVRIPEKWKHLVDARRGSRAKGFVSFIDFGPTLLNLAGIDVPKQVDGQPFLGKGQKWAEVEKRDEAFGYADRFDEKYDLVRTLRKGKFEYVRSYQPFNFDGIQNDYRYKMIAYREWRDLFKAGKLNPTQSEFFLSRPAEALYDIEADPHESNNLAEDPDHAKTLVELRKNLSDRVKSLPDLSMYPENFMVDKALGNPVKYGQAHENEIARLVDIADLQLLSFAEAKAGIEKALSSESAWERYWGCIVCSSHGKDAASMNQKVSSLAAGDENRLVRVRAAEFLGLTGAGDPRPIILKALKESDSEVESNLILNTAVLLQDGKPGYQFSVTPDSANFKGRYVAARIAYLSGKPAPAKRRKQPRAGKKKDETKTEAQKEGR